MDKFVTRTKRKRVADSPQSNENEEQSRNIASCHLDPPLPGPGPSKIVESQQDRTYITQDANQHYSCSSSHTPLGQGESNTNRDPSMQVSLSKVDIGVISEDIFHSSAPVIQITVENLHNVLKELFVPELSFKFPSTQFKNKYLKFQHSWLQRWGWLAYSKVKDGAYCKYCVLFASDCVGNDDFSVRNASLVGQPFRKWKDALEKFQNHSKTNYHMLATVSAENFLKVMSGKLQDVATILSSKRMKEREENRAAILPIIETIIFCGENELPLRGDDDSGPITLEKPEKKDGKFRALIRYRASIDEKLKNHMLHGSRNSSYFSPEIQNEIIGICGQLIQERLAKNINNAECFSIIGDETLDVSGQEQFSLCIRYVMTEGQPSLREDFVTFFPLTDLSAENVTTKILESCHSLGIDLDKLIGQGYDGASTMSGCKTGVQTRILQLYPKAMYVHCSSHRLNLVLSESLNVPLISNSLGVLKEVTKFFRHNAQAGNLLKDKIAKILPESKKYKLLAVCETRFVERQISINTFVELFPAIVPSLQDLSELDRSFSSTASTLLSAMEKGSFLVSVLVCEYLFSLTLPLSTYLQNPQHELSSAVKFSEDIVQVLKDLRTGEQDKSEFHKIFQKSLSIAETVLESQIDIPRQAKKQTNRDNIPHDSPEEYYRRSVFIPAVDSLIVNLHQRFSQNKVFLSAIEMLLPKNCKLEHTTEIMERLKVYYEHRISQSAFEAEYILWCKKWSSSERDLSPSQIMSILDACDKNFYPTIHYLLCVLASLPVSTCEAERSFSSLKRIKTYLRNKMSKERLTGLSLMSIHYPVPFKADDVLNVMARKGNRRLLL